MNNKKIEALLNQLAWAVRIDVENVELDCPQLAEFSSVEDVCGKPDNVVLCLTFPVDLDITKTVLFTEKNINDATVSGKYALIMNDTKNQTHTITVYSARVWQITRKW